MNEYWWVVRTNDGSIVGMTGKEECCEMIIEMSKKSETYRGNTFSYSIEEKPEEYCE